jgi:hypothetical protein
LGGGAGLGEGAAALTANLGPGLYADVPHAVYHADPVAVTSLSASIAGILLGQSPLHAWHAHPRLGGQVADDWSEPKVRGSIVHSLLLGGGADVVAVPYEDWRKKEAQAARREAVAAGKIPVLVHKLREYKAAADALRERSRLGVLLGEGMVERELVAVWRSGGEDGPLCRGRLDAWEPDALTIHDLKTCEDAKARASGAACIRNGDDVQAADYIEAMETLYPTIQGRVKYRWHFCEVVPPYGVIEAEPTGELLELGRRKWHRAVATWAKCLRDDVWPGYSEEVWRIEPPGWAMSEDLTVQLQEGVTV